MANKLSQAHLPHGLIGHLFGRLMGWLNSDMEKTAIDQLHLHGSENVLEIGFGSGIGMQYLVQKLPAENVAGVEPSDVMLRQAARRLSAAQCNRVCLRSGSSRHIPWPDQTFDAIVTVNNIQCWDLPSDLNEIKRVLKPSGFVSIAVHGWALSKSLKVTTSQEALERLRKYLEEADFLVQKGFIGKARTREPLYLLAHKRD